MRADDGSTARNAYRPITEPGKYVPTASTVGWQATEMTLFVLDSAAQFRPGPPPGLTSDTWAKDYNEIKEWGDKNSTKRTPRQTETARLWLATGPLAYHPWERQIAIAKKMSVVDTDGSWRCYRSPRRMRFSPSMPPSGTICSGGR